MDTTSIIAEDYVKFRFPAAPTFSPDGLTIVFTIKTINDTKNGYKSALFLKTVGQKGYQQISSGTHLDTLPKFSPSGKYIAFLSTRSGKFQVYVLNVQGGEAFLVTNFPHGVENFNWSHHDKKIHVIARVNEEELRKIIKPPEITPSFVLEPEKYESHIANLKRKKIQQTDPRHIKEAYYREGTAYLESRFAQPFIIDVIFPDKDQFESIEYNTKPISVPVHIGTFGYHYILGVFNLNNEIIYLARRKNPSIGFESQILTINLSKAGHEKHIAVVHGTPNNFQISLDYKNISWEAGREEHNVYDNTQIFLLDTSNNNIESITATFDRSAENSKWISIGSIMFTSPRNGTIEINIIDIITKEVTNVIGGDRNIESFAVTNDGMHLVYEVSHASFFVELFWSDKNGANEEQITHLNAKYVEEHSVANVKTFTYERDGFSFQGWVLLPADHNGKDKLPVILEIHGGPAAMWSPHEITMWQEFNFLVSKGYAVVFTNPRGSGGYGIDFRAAVWKNLGEQAGQDVISALDTALNLFPFLNQDQIGITGGSYGGYMTIWLTTHFPDKFKAGVSQRGLYEFISFVTSTDVPVWFLRQYDGIYTEKIEEYLRDSPATYMEKLNCPLLIIHSDNDYRVPVVNAEQLFWLGKYYGKTVELIRYPNEGHELSRSGRPRALIDRLNRIADWFDKYL